MAGSGLDTEHIAEEGVRNRVGSLLDTEIMASAGLMIMFWLLLDTVIMGGQVELRIYVSDFDGSLCVTIISSFFTEQIASTLFPSARNVKSLLFFLGCIMVE